MATAGGLINAIFKKRVTGEGKRKEKAARIFRTAFALW
jgi:hypothetical protein